MPQNDFLSMKNSNAHDKDEDASLFSVKMLDLQKT
jgi:hypothetical protein